MLGILSGVWVLSLAVLYLLGGRPALPWRFIPLLAVYCFQGSAALLMVQVLLRDKGRGVRALAFAAALVLAASFHFRLSWLAAGIVVGAWTLRRSSWDFSGRLAIWVFTFFVGKAAVWNCGYITAILAGNRLLDPQLINWERVIYSTLLGRPPEGGAMFPVFGGYLFVFLENAYVMLFPMILATIIALVRWADRALLERFAAAIFLAYLIALSVFLAVPSMGPAIYSNELMASEYSGTPTARLQAATLKEWKAVQTHGALSGFGYFVGFPSLHVAQTVIILMAARRFRPLLWCFIPLSAALMASTFLLGHHYMIDVPGGVAAGLLAHAASERLHRPVRGL